MDLTNTVTVVTMTTDISWQLDPPDPLGFQWRSPGTYVLAHDQDGTQLASIKVNFAQRPGGNDITERAARVITNALHQMYGEA